MRESETAKPRIEYHEGVLDYFNAVFPHESGDPRWLGFSVGKCIIGTYLVEILLQYALDNEGVKYRAGHNLYELYTRLPRARRDAVEAKYTEIMSSRVEWTWDIAQSVLSYLQYLGKQPLVDFRYYWKSRRRDGGVLFSPEIIYAVVYSLFIVLHDYPESGPVLKRYDTQFVSLEDSLKEDRVTGIHI